MRDGTQIAEDVWQALIAQALKPNDQRLNEVQFRNAHEGGLLWEIVGRLLQMRAFRDAQAAGKPLIYAQAIDVPT